MLIHNNLTDSIPLILAIHKNYSREEGRRIFSAIRNDRVVWDSLKNSSFRESAIAFSAGEIERWSPTHLGKLALSTVLLGVENLPTGAELDLLIETHPTIDLTVAELAESFTDEPGEWAFELPPAKSLEAIAGHPIRDLCHASVIGLALNRAFVSQDRPFPKSLLQPDPKPELWHTAYGFLLGETSDQFRFLRGLIQADSGPAELEVGLRAIFSHPSSPGAKVLILYDLLRDLPHEVDEAALLQIRRFDSTIAAGVSQKFLSDSPPARSAGRTLSGALGSSLRNALLLQVAGVSGESPGALIQALQELGHVEEDLIKRYFWTTPHATTSGDGGTSLSHDPGTLARTPVFELSLQTFEAARNLDDMEIESAATILEVESSDVDLLITKAQVACASGEFGEQTQKLAKTAYQEAMRQADEFPLVTSQRLLRLSEVFIRCHLPAEAVRVSVSALERNHTDPQIFILLNRAYRNAGQLELAEAAIRAAQLLTPEGQLELRRALAETLEASGQWRAAFDERASLLAGIDLPGLEDLRELSKCALRSGENKIAIEIAQEALLLDADDSITNAILGEALINSGSKEEGIQKLQHAVQIKPQIPEPWITLAASQKALGDFNRAMDTLRSATHAAPDSPEIFTQLGILYLEDHSPTQAATHLQRAVELSPADPEANSLLGHTLLALGRIDEADEYITRSFAISPFDLDIASTFARVKLAAGKPAEALQSLALILQNAPDSPEPYFDYGRALLEAGQSPAEAVAAFEKVLEFDADNIEARGRLADALLASGQVSAASEIYGELLDSPSALDSQWKAKWLGGAGRAAFELGDSEKSIVLCREAVELSPENRLMHRYLAQAYMAADLTEDALESARNALSLGADDLNTLKWFANLAIGEGSQAEALSALKRAVELAPHQVELLLLLGQTQLRAGETADAWDTFSSLLGAEAISSDELEQVADGFSELGDERSAIDSLRLAVKRTSQPAEVLLILSDVLVKAADYQSALESIDEAAGYGYDKSDLPMRKARVLQLLNRPQAALACMQQAIHLEPENADLHGWASDILRKSGEIREGLTYAEKRLRLDPKNLDARRQTADLARGVLENDYAMRILKNGWPDSGPAGSRDLAPRPGIQDFGLGFFCLYGDLSLEKDDEISAAEALTAAVQANASHPRVLALQARIRARQGDLEEAKGNFYTLASAYMSTGNDNQEDCDVLISLGEAAAELELWDLAEKLFDKAILQRPREPLPALLALKNLVLRAEAEALSQNLGVVNHAPGPHALSGESFAKIENLIRSCQSNLVTPEGRSDWKPWELRANAIFHSDIRSLGVLEKESVQSGHAFALIIAARQADRLDLSSKAARANLHLPLARGLLALNLVDQGLADEALEEVHEALRLSPNDPFVRYIAGRTSCLAGQPEEALEHIERALEQWPDEPVWHALAAEWWLDLSGLPSDDGDRRAVDHLERAVGLDPGNTQYLVRLGEIYQADGALEDAIFKFQEACQLDPKNAIPWSRLAGAQLAQDQFEAAEKSILIAMELAPDEADYAVLHTRIAWEEGNSAEVLDRVEAALSKDSSHTEAHHLKALALAHLSRPADALASIDLAVKYAEDPQPYLIDRARILAQTQGKGQAMKFLEELSQSYPEDPAVYGLMARFLVEAGETDKAVAAAQKALKKGTGEIDARELAYLNEMVGRLQRRAGQLDQAIYHLSEAVRLDPMSIEAHSELGLAYLDRRDYAEAYQALQHAISIHPNQARLYYQAGVTLKESKEYPKAETMLRKAAELSPSDLSIHRQLGAVVALNIVNNSREAALSL